MDESDVLLQVEGGDGEQFEDREFPPTEASLGEDVATRVEVEWRRPSQFAGRGGALFKNVEAKDAKQGGLGDCWLISSIAAIAEFPGVVNHMFVSPSTATDGKYQCRIYAPESKTWEVVTVDDQIPCRPGRGPAFAQAAEGEFWVPVLEKAYAKFVGSYSKLSGGWPALALESMTGAKSELYTFKDGKATVMNFGDLTVRKAAALTGGASIFSNGKSHSFDEFFPVLMDFDQKGNLMTLASPGKDVYSEAQGPSDDFGIVGGHAYTLIAVREVEGHRLCNIRNPWGDFEWGGDWSDRSEQWDAYPGVKEALQPQLDKDDGEFWMPYDEMVKIFTSVTINFMDKTLASQPGPPPTDDNGNPTWITELASMEFAVQAVENMIKEKTGMDIDLNPCMKTCCTII